MNPRAQEFRAVMWTAVVSSLAWVRSPYKDAIRLLVCMVPQETFDLLVSANSLQPSSMVCPNFFICFHRASWLQSEVAVLGSFCFINFSILPPPPLHNTYVVLKSKQPPNRMLESWDAVLQKRLAWAMFVLLLLTLVLCQPTELILGFFFV